MTMFERKTRGALIAALAITAAGLPLQASPAAAGDGGAFAAGAIGGLAAGAILGGGLGRPTYRDPVYAPAPVYAPRRYYAEPIDDAPVCHIERRRVWDGYGYVRERYRVCD